MHYTIPLSIKYNKSRPNKIVFEINALYNAVLEVAQIQNDLFS